MAGFLPECLTVSLGSECNLNCVYCYKHNNQNNQGKSGKILLDEDYLVRAISAAALTVIENCLKSGRTFFFGFQGEGEPFAEPGILKKVYNKIVKIAADNNINNFSFITTNGTFNEEHYIWASMHFDRICLSIDGPPDIHDMHRPFKSGQPSFCTVKNTLDILRQYRSDNIVCRSTITRYNVNRQESIIRFLVKDLKIKHVQFEPVYNFSQNDDLYPDPAIFAAHFIRASKAAQSLGAELIYSGFADKEFSLPYCNINKRVLFLTPSGKATACMFRENEPDESIYTIGYYNERKDKFILNEKRIQEFIKYLRVVQSLCAHCSIRQHCVKGCPDVCLIDRQLKPGNGTDIENSLRCRINKIIYT
jgi:uncharacterized protein